MRTLKPLDQVEPQFFENEDYRIEWRSRQWKSSNSEHSIEDNSYTNYQVLNKKDNTKSELAISVITGYLNIDGVCKLALTQDGQEPVYLSAIRPCFERRAKDPSRYNSLHPNELEIGGHFVGKIGDQHFVRDIDDLMGIYRSLQKGDFKLARQEDFLLEIRRKEVQRQGCSSYSKDDAIKSILNFMDNYIFNTPEAKEVLAEYMHKYPLPQKSEEMSLKDNKQLANVRKKLVRNIDKVLGTNFEEVKLAKPLKNIEKAVSDNIFNAHGR